MSVIAIHVDPSRITIGSDACAYDPRDGRVRAIASKVVPLPEFDCFIANTGAGMFAFNVRTRLPHGLRGFDDLLEVIVDVIREVDDRYLSSGYPFETRSTVLLGGWSEARGTMELYKVHTKPREGINTNTGETFVSEPFQLIPVRQIYVSNHPGDELLAAFGLSGGEMTANEWAARMVCANRASTETQEFASGSTMPSAASCT